jgi:hypothetical protein
MALGSSVMQSARTAIKRILFYHLVGPSEQQGWYGAADAADR